MATRTKKRKKQNTEKIRLSNEYTKIRPKDRFSKPKTRGKSKYRIFHVNRAGRPQRRIQIVVDPRPIPGERNVFTSSECYVFTWEQFLQIASTTSTFKVKSAAEMLETPINHTGIRWISPAVLAAFRKARQSFQ